MENITNKVVELVDGRKFYVMRQALYKGVTYLFVAGVTEDEEDFTNDFAFMETKVEDGKTFYKLVEDKAVLEVLFKNITLDDTE